MSKIYYVYILKCADNSYYTGVTSNLEQQIDQHNSGAIKGYTSEKLPVELIYMEETNDIWAAAEREKQIKKWSRAKKEALIIADENKLHELAKCKNESTHKNQTAICRPERSRGVKTESPNMWFDSAHHDIDSGARKNFLEFLGNDLVDTHCHLISDDYKDKINQVVVNAKNNNVTKIIDVAISVETSKLALQNALRFPQVFATIGVDPDLLNPTSDLFAGQEIYSNADKWIEEQQEQIEQLLQNANKVVMIGECGMDSYWLYQAVRQGRITKEEMTESLIKQEKLFRIHCELAEKYNLPLTIHGRNSEKRCLEILSEYKVTGVFHSFTGGYKVAKQIIDKGFFLGVNGIVTYKSAEEIRNTYKKILGTFTEHVNPKWFYDRGVVFETDAPWLNPFDPKEQNEPKNIKTIYEYMVNLLQS